MKLKETQMAALNMLLEHGNQRHRFAHHKTLDSLEMRGLVAQLKNGDWKITAKGKKAVVA